MSQPSTAGKTAGRFVPGERILVAAHEQPGPFFKALLTHLDREDRRQLNARLARAERDQRCLHRAVFLMVVLLMISVAGLGYCALLFPRRSSGIRPTSSCAA